MRILFFARKRSEADDFVDNKLADLGRFVQVYMYNFIVFSQIDIDQPAVKSGDRLYFAAADEIGFLK